MRRGFTFMLPGEGFAPVAKRFTVPFGSVGPTAFVVAMLTVMAGVASSPWLLPRVTMTPGVYETRKSLGWATVFFGLIMLTAAAVSVYMRDFVMDIVKDGPPATLPDWMRQLVDLGFARVESAAGRLSFTSFEFARDTVLLSLPVAAGLAQRVRLFRGRRHRRRGAGGGRRRHRDARQRAGEDVVNGLSWEPLPRDARLWVARVAIVGVAVFGGVITLLAPTDPLRLVLWCLAITGSTLFPVLVLSIWWKRMNAFGAMAGLACGFAVVGADHPGGRGEHPGSRRRAGGSARHAGRRARRAAGEPATPGPSRSMLELVREIRIPGGEVVYDREMRLLAAQKPRARLSATAGSARLRACRDSAATTSRRCGRSRCSAT